MQLERRTVSRKTQNDGRLEITKHAAASFEPLSDGFELELDGARTPARLGTLDCTCRGVNNPHVHYFIESPTLKRLAPGSEVDLDLDVESRLVRVDPTT